MECSYWEPSLSDKHVGAAAHSLPYTNHKASNVCRSSSTIKCRPSSLVESMSRYLIRRIEESHNIRLRTHTEIVGVGGTSNQHIFIITSSLTSLTSPNTRGNS